MKIEKRKFDATDDEVIVEVARIWQVFDKAGMFTLVAKIKSELKCTEGDLLEFLQRYPHYFVQTRVASGLAIAPTEKLRADMPAIQARAAAQSPVP